jgi:hypothetical protein
VTQKNGSAHRDDLMHDLLEQAWEMWRSRHTKRDRAIEEVPDFSVLTYGEMDDMQHWDMPSLPLAAHRALLDEMGRRWQAAKPCECCGKRSPR